MTHFQKQCIYTTTPTTKKNMSETNISFHRSSLLISTGVFVAIKGIVFDTWLDPGFTGNLIKFLLAFSCMIYFVRKRGEEQFLDAKNNWWFSGSAGVCFTNKFWFQLRFIHEKHTFLQKLSFFTKLYKIKVFYPHSQHNKHHKSAKIDQWHAFSVLSG